MRDLTNAEAIAHLLSNHTVALGKEGRLDEALARYDAALKLVPQLVAAWYNRGIDMLNSGRPNDALAHNNLGLARLNLGDAEGARADWIRALELEPGMREAGENLDRLLRTR